MLFGAVLLGATLASLGGLAALGIRESNNMAEEERTRAFLYARYLADRKGKFISFYLNDGKTMSGRVAVVDRELLVVLIDVRRFRRDETTGELLGPKTAPLSTDLQDILLADIDGLEVYNEEEGDEYEEEEPDDYP